MIRDFYTVTLPDGTKSDVWEKWISEVENTAAPALRRALEASSFRVNDQDRRALSRWIGLQYLRGPSNRRQHDEIAAFALRMQVGMGGLPYLRHAMSEGLSRDVPWEEAEQVWNDIMSPQGPSFSTSGDDHLDSTMRVFDQVVDLIYTRSWRRARFTRHRLLLSDAPVSLVDDDPSPWTGTGLFSAFAVTVPLDRRTLLWLERADLGSPEADSDIPPSTWLARTQNATVVSGAERFAYFHPDDESFLAVPGQRPRPARMHVSGGGDLANRDRPLSDVLDQIADEAERREGGLIADYTWPIPGYQAAPTQKGSRTTM